MLFIFPCHSNAPLVCVLVTGAVILICLVLPCHYVHDKVKDIARGFVPI